MKKILIISSGDKPMPPVNGGAVEKLVDDFANSNNINKKYDITIISRYDANAKRKKCGYKNIYVNMNGFLNFFMKCFYHFLNKFFKKFITNNFIMKVNKKLKKDGIKYDIIIIENTPQYVTNISKKYYDKIVLHLHNDYLNINNKISSDYIKQYNSIFSVSNFVKNRILEVEPNYKNVHVLYNGVGYSNKSYNKIDVRKKYNIPDNKLILVYSGRVVPEKGILDVIKIINENNFENIVLLVIGPGKKKIVNNEKVIFTGYINHDDLESIYSQCDFGIVPSKCNEAFGVSAIEFLNAGLPIIYTNDGALPEIIDTKNGIMINKNFFNDEILKTLNLINDGNIKNSSFDKIRLYENANLYSIDSYCKLFSDLLEDVE